MSSGSGNGMTTLTTHSFFHAGNGMTTLTTHSKSSGPNPGSGQDPGLLSNIAAFFGDKENREIFIKTGIGTGGFLLGIIFMLIVSKCKRKKETEVINTPNNGVITNGRTPEEMDSLIQKYINDSHTMKKQWQNASSENYTHQQHTSFAAEDDIPMQSMDIVRVGHQESTVSYPTQNEHVAPSEYTNSGLVQSYRGEENNGMEESATARGENYFLLQKDFVEINGMQNETAPQGYNADNYFLLERDFIEGGDMHGQSQFSLM